MYIESERSDKQYSIACRNLLLMLVSISFDSLAVMRFAVCSTERSYCTVLERKVGLYIKVNTHV
jgi:hypothetical protein